MNTFWHLCANFLAVGYSINCQCPKVQHQRHHYDKKEIWLGNGNIDGNATRVLLFELFLPQSLQEAFEYRHYLLQISNQRVLNTKRGSRSSSFWVPRNLSHHLDRKDRTGDTVLLNSREMTGRSQTLPWWWLVGEGVKTTENQLSRTCIVKNK